MLNSKSPLSVAFVFAILACLHCSSNRFLNADHIAPSEFTVADGFEISVWATTPQLYNPTNFDVDAKGRLWVTEAVNYRNFRNEELGISEEKGDRVVILEEMEMD